MSEIKKCKHCGNAIQYISYMQGPKWMHIKLGASFPSEGKGTLWEFCKNHVAEPEEPDENADVSSERPLP